MLSQSVQECKNIDRCMCSQSFAEAANEFTIMKWFLFYWFLENRVAVENRELTFNALFSGKLN